MFQQEKILKGIAEHTNICTVLQRKALHFSVSIAALTEDISVSSSKYCKKLLAEMDHLSFSPQTIKKNRKIIIMTAKNYGQFCLSARSMVKGNCSLGNKELTNQNVKSPSI